MVRTTTEISLDDRAVPLASDRPSMLLRAIEVWLIISVVEVIHGVARAAFLQPMVGDFPARQIGVFTGSILIFATTWMFSHWVSARSASDCFVIGAAWVALTVGFEFVLGKLVLDLSWERLLSDYDVTHGGLMPLGLLAMLLSPLIVFRLRRR